MSDPSNDPSIFDEPHLRGTPQRPDPSEERAERTLAKARRRDATPDEKIDHTVWDEPGVSADLAGPVPDGELTYAEWLDVRRAETGFAWSWLVALGVALAAGPWAILGAFYGSGQTMFSILAICVFGPVVEEVMKTAAVMVVVEKRPFLFRHPVQVLLCAVAGAAVFACVENVLYLHVYISNPSEWLVRWRWSVCVVLHTGCTLVAAMGIMRVWRDLWRRRARPRLTLAYPYLVAAIMIHGTYNAFAVAFHYAQHRF